MCFHCTTIPPNSLSTDLMYNLYFSYLLTPQSTFKMLILHKMTDDDRGRPPKLGKFDEMVKQYLKQLQVQGNPINKTVVTCVAVGIVKHYDKFLLQKNGGHKVVGNSWAESFLRY